MTTTMPALYIGHGAPPLLDDPVWSGELAAWARELPRPTAIVIISAHWEAAPISLSAPDVELVYDFGGFAPKYYNERYDAPYAHDVVAQLTSMLSGQEVHQHSRRGLDHGAWVPLTIMYPEADIPVVQMSLPNHDPGQLLQLGRQLRDLREQGVLVIGSGFLTHGLPFLKEFRIDATAPQWSVDFDLWADEALRGGDVDELSAYADKAPGMPYAHPTVEHLSPLFVTLGVSGDPGAAPEQKIDGYWMGLSKRSFQVA